MNGTTDPNLAPASVETAPPAAPAVDDMSIGDLRSTLAQGIQVPAPIVDSGAAAPAKEPEAPAPADTPEQTPEGEETPPPAAETPQFQFKAEMTDEEYAAEQQKYLEAYEITPEIQFMLDRQKAQIEALQQQQNPYADLGTPELVPEVVSALEKLMTFREDPVTGKFVPDATAIVSLLDTHFTKETPAVLMELAQKPSTRYGGLTMFQEFLVDYGQLDAQGFQNLQTFLDNRGRFPIPSVVPPGIDPRYSEAFWNSPDREAIEEAVEASQMVLEDPMATDYDRQSAQLQLNGIAQRLSMIQAGLDAQKAAQQQQQNIAQQNRQIVEQQAEQSYVETSVQMLRNLSGEISKSLTMFDESGAQIAATAISKLVEAALTDDQWSKYAQEDLAKQGIKFDWGRGRQVLDRLWDQEKIIAFQKAQGANPLAIQVAQKEKGKILQELRGLEQEFLGQLTKKLVTGNTAQLKKAAAVKPKGSAVRPKVDNTGVPNTGGDVTDAMSLEEMRGRMGELAHELRKTYGVVPSL